MVRPSPRVPPGTRVYAIGDIHGRGDLLADLHARIRADAAGAAASRKLAVYVGDYIDRGPDSKGVVDELLAGPLPGFESVYLKGNHEDFLLHFLDQGTMGPAWMLNGGGATLVSYDVGVISLLLGERGLRTVRDQLAKALPPAHLAFFRALRLSHGEGDYLFVHAGIRPNVPLDEQREADLIWIREEFLDSRTAFGKVVVHGHTISPEPEVLSNRIGIDTGAYRSGRLTCLVLEGDTQRFLHT